jgi:phosphatidylglycerol:prolipoprotein diacylglycerol transferase
MLNLTPDPIAFQLGPIPVYWYGIGYALGLAAAYLVMVRLARRAGEDAEILGNGIIIVAVAALIGGRAYHVIDQWALYQGDPIKIFLPPYSGLGVYGGIATGTVAAFLYARYKRVPFLRWADIVAPGLFVMQAIARWGNFFNQELYGTPTTLPWGIPIDCAHRLQDAYPCETFPFDTTRFHPLFLYESLSGLIGAVVLIWIGFHLRKRLRPGDLLLLFFVWYGLVRFALETFRQDNWTFFGIPTAQIVSMLFVFPALVILAWRHRRGHPLDDPPSNPAVATWGAIGRPVDPDAATPDGDEGYDDEDDDGTEFDDAADHLDDDVNDDDEDEDAEHVRAGEDTEPATGNETPDVGVERTDDDIEDDPGDEEPDRNRDRTEPASA